MFNNNNSTFRHILGAGILSLMLITTGCAGITDAGVSQDATQQSAQETQVDDQEEPDQNPFPNDDEPGVIYDEPDL